MPSMIDRPKTDAEWRAEEDARSLAAAEEIKGDKVRMDKAQEAAKRMADEEADRARAMRKVAGQKGQQPSGGDGRKAEDKHNGPPPTGNSYNVFQRLDKDA